MVILAFLACDCDYASDDAFDTAETVDLADSEVPLVDTDTDTAANTVDTAEAEIEECPVLNGWTDNAKITAGLTLGFHLDGCGVVFHAICDNPEVVGWSFSGSLDTGDFQWKVSALTPGSSSCVLTIADPATDTRIDYAASYEVL